MIGPRDNVFPGPAVALNWPAALDPLCCFEQFEHCLQCLLPFVPELFVIVTAFSRVLYMLLLLMLALMRRFVSVELSRFII